MWPEICSWTLGRLHVVNYYEAAERRLLFEIKKEVATSDGN
jgi:hypothetical protein